MLPSEFSLIPDCARCHWVCSETDVEDSLDWLCATFLRSGCRFAYVSACSGSLIENISVLENLWLPVAWSEGWSRHLVVQRLMTLLEDSPLHNQIDAADLLDLLEARPVSLTLEQIGVVILLRAAMGAPDWVVIHPRWFDDLGRLHLRRLRPVMKAWLGAVRWIVPAVDHAELDFSGDWIKLGLSPKGSW